MKFKAITCESLSREMYFAASFSEHVIDFKFFNRDYHDDPKKINKALQTEIDFTSYKMWDRINSYNVVELLENKMFFIKLLNGEWDEKDFLVVPGGKKIVATNDDNIIKCM